MGGVVPPTKTSGGITHGKIVGITGACIGEFSAFWTHKTAADTSEVSNVI